MGRFYALSKKVSDEVKEQIVAEVKAIEGVKDACIVDEPKDGMIVIADDADYPEVMNRAVNICARGGEVELSFDHFTYED